MRTTPLFWAYSVATRVALPFVARAEQRKLRAAGVSDARQHEKLGIASLDRPNGRLIWFHAASVGESLSVLSLIECLGRALPSAEFLITSGTATSAKLIGQRMPPRCRHQFAPLDAPKSLDRFLDHWRPDAAILVESELWPNMLMRTNRKGVPLALINARLSENSLRGWRNRARTARLLLSKFRLILTQTEALAKDLIALGAPPQVVAKSVNLKSLSSPLPIDAQLVADLRAHLNTRPVWIAASTHAGEEQSILDAHAKLVADHPDLCLILAPRHPERGDEVADFITARGWSLDRRSLGAMPEGPVYLADTLGELGSWYALSSIVFLGGSLLPIGGHNPFEVAQSGGTVISGPHVTNFEAVYSDMCATGAAKLIEDSEMLASTVDHFLSNPEALDTACAASGAFRSSQVEHLNDVAAQLIATLDLQRAAGPDA